MPVSLLRPTLAVLAGLALAGCELLPPRPISVAETEVVSVTGFDRARADALVADADAAAARGDTAGALADYRQAGLAWPESEAAWLGLRTTSDALGDEGEHAAAEFMLRRVRLYDGASLVVQREVNRALRLYVEDGGDADAPQTRVYAQALADYYSARLEAAGLYQPLDPYMNIEDREWPAVVGTGLAVGVYGGILGASAANQ
ncbi:MAG: hypothetical protein KDA49_12240 [Rhodospirillaceae bacterium]|nr:hypothetical protein [Rhodospirillaceae bacterium]MCA8933234.1 hypothetical protein [Rhodospirillaceae bacterium]